MNIRVYEFIDESKCRRNMNMRVSMSKIESMNLCVGMCESKSKKMKLNCERGYEQEGMCEKNHMYVNGFDRDSKRELNYKYEWKYKF